MKVQEKIEKWKNLTSYDLLTPNLTCKVKSHFGNWVILKACHIVIHSGIVASFEQKMPSDYMSKQSNAEHTERTHIAVQT